MSMTHRCPLIAAAFSLSLFGACGGQSDYQGGGRRTDLGHGTDSGIALTSGGDANTAGSAGTSGASNAGNPGRAGYAGCAADNDAGQGLITDCTP
jgi:hypothetical protein